MSELAASDPSPAAPGGRAARFAARPRLGGQSATGAGGPSWRNLQSAFGSQCKRIHEAALDALEVIGFAKRRIRHRDFDRCGAILGEDGASGFPRGLVEDMLKKAARGITLHGREENMTCILRFTRALWYSGRSSPMWWIRRSANTASRPFRTFLMPGVSSTASTMCILPAAYGLPRHPRQFEMDMNTLYACCASTTKHVGVSFTSPDYIPSALEMLHLIAGGEEQWRARPFVSNSNCFCVVPPMKFAQESCQ